MVSTVRKNKGRKTQKNKRWYLDATIGKSVPIVGGTSLKAGSGTLQKRSLLSKTVKQAVVAMQDNKQKIITGGGTSSMTHNTIYTLNPLGNIPIGAGANSRVGSEIYVKNIILRLMISNRTAAASATGRDSATMFRVMWVKIDQDYLSGSDSLSTGVGSTDVFVQASNYLALSAVDYNRAEVLDDQMIKIYPNYVLTNSVNQHYLDFT